MRSELTLLHTNDLHGQLAMLPRLAALIARERARDPQALLLDAGDLGLDGRCGGAGAHLVRRLRYDALAPGNYECEVRVGRASLGQVGSPCVAANVATGALGFETAPWLACEAHGLRVAVLGLATPPVYPSGHRLHRPNADEVPVDDPFAAARAWLPRLRAEADLLVVLSHLGLRADIRLAEEASGMDLIVGGHSHHRLPRLLHVGPVAIAQAGVNGAYLGVIRAERSGESWQFEGRLEPLWQTSAGDEGMRAHLLGAIERYEPERLAPAGETDGCWADPWQENAWANFVTDAFREAAGAEIGFGKAQNLLPALDPGPVHPWDVERCADFFAEPLFCVTLSGEALGHILEHSASDLPWDQHPGVPRAFHLPGNALLQASGLRVEYDLLRPAGERVRRVEVGGAALQAEKLYRVAVPEFLAKGYSGFTWFREDPAPQRVGPKRAIISEALRALRALPAPDGRLVFAPG